MGDWNCVSGIGMFYINYKREKSHSHRRNNMYKAWEMEINMSLSEHVKHGLCKACILNGNATAQQHKIGLNEGRKKIFDITMFCGHLKLHHIWQDLLNI